MCPSIIILEAIVSLRKVFRSQKKEAMVQGFDCLSWEKITSMGTITIKEPTEEPLTLVSNMKSHDDNEL
ncbi:unnamed protein product [Lactuca virosa]|uniref:Uncharacterized protein n=1 Tax=Lactuca virosa TaxID=75947 RepID=A0AAU9NT73_9ASTR|nr:unnamed protein product [Lactuca virosa]